MLQRFFQRLSLKTYREDIRQNQLKLIDEIKHVHQQLFVANPVLVVQNVKMYLPLFYVDHIQKGIYQSRNFYEIETLEFLRLHYKSFDHVVDIGTNIGNHMLYYCSNLSAKSVICFEPNTFNRSTLQKNIELNYLEQLVTVYPFAIGEIAGKGVQTNFSFGNTGMNRIDKVSEETTSSTDSIDIRSLDSFHLQAVDFMKIDVEGFEADVLKGSAATIQRCKPVVMIEVFESNRLEVDALMQAYGYSCFITIEDYNSIYVPL